MSSAISGKVGGIYKQTSDAAVEFTDEATTANDGRTQYTITDANKRYWDKTATFTVKKNTVIQTSGFHLELAGGVVVFDTALEEGDVVTVSGKHVVVAQIGGFFNWSLNPGVEFQDTTAFVASNDANYGWKTQVATLKDWSATAASYWALDNNLFDAYAAGTELIFVFFVDSGVAKIRFEGSGLVKTDISTAYNELVKQNLNLTGSGGIYNRAA